MVNLSIDPPPFGRNPSSSSGSSGLGRLLVFAVLLVAVFGGGVLTGRWWTLRGHLGLGRRHATTAAPDEAPAPAPTAARAPAAPAPVPGAQTLTGQPVPAQPAGAGTAAPPAIAGQQVAAQPPAAVTPPSAPQGPLVRRVSVTLRGPLEDSIAQAMPPGEKAWASELTQVVNRLLVWSMQVSRDGRKGDKLEVLYELPTAQPSEIQAIGMEGPATKEPVVLALRFGSQKLGKLLTAYRFKPEGAPFARYYTAEGVDVEEHLVDTPVEGYEQITSLLRDGRRHKGVDFKTPVGTPVRAPFEGRVEKRNWNWRANGNCLELVDVKTGRRGIFLHLEAAPKEMQPGRMVRKGEEIAKSGNSGHSTAPHLHFQLEAPDGKVLDPFAVMATRSVALDGAQKAAFQTERARLEPMLLATAAQ